MFDWTTKTKDPSDSAVGLEMQAFLASLLAFYPESRNDFIRNYFRDMRVMDIGAGEHDASSYNEERWEHGIISKVARAALGVEIHQDLCDHYNNKGFRFTCIDATSDKDLGERFDRVFIGDVIEHVSNPVAMLQFAKRHLAGGQGRILVSTPNPFAVSFMTSRTRSRNRPFFMTNFEHVSWITPTNANELARRAGLKFTRIYFPETPRKPVHKLVAKLLKAGNVPELAHKEYIYEFTA